MQSSCKKAELVEVIKIVATQGDGKTEPFKEVTQYWTKEGTLICEE
ncbi:hypothetical protein GCM10011409_00270 [Lentibacillus populi]|uniref:Uncharacterized protein n=1 Tax=Lentibacillus populi TaxID=1827502 RepID=A0A9W5X3U9_9BACI|nr:hypothetical protein [Lentibacillus populi]GGB26909.1 hypothetical protein GCM10011409_00270 [Lentibacillus populi]